MADRPDNELQDPETPDTAAGEGAGAPVDEGAAEAAMAAVGEGLDVGEGGETAERVTPPMEPAAATGLGGWEWGWAGVFAAVAGLALLRLAWVVRDKEFSLAEDEAQ